MKNLLKTTVLMSALLLAAFSSIANGEHASEIRGGSTNYICSPAASSSQVTVKIHAGSKASSFLKVHWKDGSNWKKKSISSRTSATFKVPAGAKLYYTLDNGSSKKYFMDAPSSGSKSYKF